MSKTLPNLPLFLAQESGLRIPPMGVVLVVLLALAATFWLFRSPQSGLRRERSTTVFAATWLGVIVVAWLMLLRLPLREWSERQTLEAGATLLLIPFALAFVLRLHNKWIAGNMTPAELAGGREGVVAWLSVDNCVLATLVAVLTWLGFGVPLLLTLAFTFGALLWTFGALLAAPGTTGRPTRASRDAVLPETSGSEREKVLAMLEAGRLTAEESAELLNAQAASAATERAVAAPLSPARRLVLIGGGAVLLAFFFPWYQISPREELARGLELSGMGGTTNSDVLQLIGSMVPQGAPTAQISLVGAEMQHGMGWLTLALALTAALLPFFATSMDRATLRLFQLLALGVGSVILLSLVSTGIRWVGFGLVMALIGYAIQWLGVLRERRAA